MGVSATVPEQLLTVVAATTIFTIMFALGLEIAFGEFRWLGRQTGLIARGLFAVLIAVPVLAIAVSRIFELSRPVEIGVLLMAISPGAPVALRRSLEAGGHRSFAPALQILMAMLAAVSMPLSIVLLDRLYAGHASIQPVLVAKQVLIAQLLPLALGMAVSHQLPAMADRLARVLGKLGTLMLLVLVVLALVDVWRPVVDAGLRVALAIATLTMCALLTGRVLGGPADGTRTAVAISSAARNPGLALLVATLNGASEETKATVLAYLVVAAITVLPYVIWRRRSAGRTRRTSSMMHF